MKIFTSLLFILTFVLSCTIPPEEISDNAAFVTYLGNDTLAVEEFQQVDNIFTAKVVLRSPRTTLHSYTLILDDSGGIDQFTQRSYDIGNGFMGEGEMVRSIQRMGDSLAVTVMNDNEESQYMTPYEKGILPFIDMVHWPYELAFKRVFPTNRDTVIQPLLSGSRISDFIIAHIEGDSATIRHPFRGVMGVNISDAGHLKYLDAGQTTRKLTVFRTPALDINKLGIKFGEADKRGNPFGELSGAETADFSFKDAEFRVEYGSPKKRGRELFGGIVPWGERWRTGANRATHFYTSKDLVMEDLEIPAGEYTLFTIPEPEGGTLIINKQTGQNGRSYDESRDLGRVPMSIRQKESVTEDFTITIEQTESGGVLNLIWGNTVFFKEFRIK